MCCMIKILCNPKAHKCNFELPSAPQMSIGIRPTGNWRFSSDYELSNPPKPIVLWPDILPAVKARNIY